MKKLFIIFSFVLLALCFLPALSLPFAHHDNVRFFDKFYAPLSANPQNRDPQYAMVYLLGRPLTAEIHQIIYTHVYDIKNLCIVRWLTVFIFAICAGILADIFYSLGLKALDSLCLSIAIFILPGTQDAVIMLAIQNALAVLAVLWAYLVSCRTSHSGFEELSNSFVVFCLVLTSMLLYPQWSFFIFVPVLVQYLIAPLPALPQTHKAILRLMLIFITTAIFYYSYIKTFVSINNARAGSYAFTIDLNFLYWKTLSVFSKIIPMSFNFWNIYTVQWMGLALMGLTLILLRKRSVLCFLMMLWTVSFWLLARTDVILHRIFFVTSVMALTFFLLGVRNSFRADGMIAKYFIVGMMTAGLLGANYLMYGNALNYYTEFAFIKQRLTAHRQALLRIHIVLARPNGKGYNGQPTVDDTFNARTASYNFNTDTLNLLKAALKDINVPPSWWVYSCADKQQKCVQNMPLGYRLLITHSKKGQPIDQSPDMALIDFNDL